MSSPDRPALQLAVVIEREKAPNRWEDWRFRIAEVLPDEGEGYYLNLSSGAPAWFVSWRISDEDPSRAWPEAVTLSYNEAARWLDAQERVDNLPLPDDARAWLADYAAAHYRPEPKQRHRPPSFLPPERRG